MLHFLLKNGTVRKKITAEIIILSYLFFFISIYNSLQTSFVFGSLGLVSSLDIFFILSCFLLSFSFIFSLYYKDMDLMKLEVISLTLLLATLPIFLEGAPRFRSCFPIGGEVDYLIRHGHLQPDFVRYHNWPGLIIYSTIVIIISNIKLINLLLYTPVVSHLLYLLVLISILRLICSDMSQVLLISWIFISINWINQDFFAPQNFAYFLYLSCLFLLFLMCMKNENKWEIKTLFLFLFIALVISHLLTPFVLLLDLIVTYIFIKANSITSVTIRTCILLLLILLFSWQMYGADFMFPKLLKILSNSFFLDNVVSSSVDRIVSGSIEHSFITRYRLFYSIFIFILAAVGFICSTVKYKYDKINILFLSFIFINLFMMVAGGYGGEILIRIMFFSLLPLAYLISANYRCKYLKIILTLFLLISPISHAIGKYGSEIADYTPKGDIVGADFFYSHALQNTTLVSHYDSLFNFKYLELFRRTRLSYEEESGFNLGNLKKIDYIWVTDSSQRVCNYLCNENESNSYYNYLTNLKINKQFCLIYSNSFYRLYYSRC